MLGLRTLNSNSVISVNQNIDPTDNRYFTLTSDKPYDRNWYKVWCTDGSVKILEDYSDVQTAWWNFKQYIDKMRTESYVKGVRDVMHPKEKGFCLKPEVLANIQ